MNPIQRAVFGVAIAVLATDVTSSFAMASSVTGAVKTPSGEAVPGAKVTLIELKRSTATDDLGAFVFHDVPPGQYLIEAISPRFGNAVGRVDVADGQAEVAVSLTIDLAVHAEHVVVTAGVLPESVADYSQSVAVLDDRDLMAKAQATIGETLGSEAGVSQTFYAPGASRPVIRGLGGDRIRVLQNGIGVGDVSSVSPDHAVTYEPHAAERVEIVRGAATLLYGSNAVGGVVNVIDQRVPDHRTGDPITGSVELRGAANSDSTTGAASLGGDLRSFGWHADFAKTDADDYAGGGDFGVKTNSDLETQSASVGASWLGETAFVGAGYNQYETNYGSAFEDEVRLDMTQKRWDVRGGINSPFGPFRLLKAKLGGTDYEHVEIEGGAVATRFLNKSIEGRVELAHESQGGSSGSFGIQGWTRDSEAIGEEAFIAPADVLGAAVFGYEELGPGSLRGQFGLRYERQSTDSSDPSLRDRDFDAPSASAGLVWKRGEEYSIGGTLSYSSRVPTIEELYSNGAHIATQTFEVGDPDLDLEHGFGLDVVLRKLTGKINGEIGAFVTDFADFVFERDTGLTFTTDEGDVLPIVQFSQSSALFWGGEAHVDFALVHADPHHLEIELRADYVHAELTDLDEPVPFQPPLRGTLGLKYQGDALSAGTEVLYVAGQDRFGAFDTETPSYTCINAWVGYRLITGALVHDFLLKGLNLNDELALNSVSRFRDVVPLPGRDVSLTYRLVF
jgi:iron complex outermembrane recepter protein